MNLIDDRISKFTIVAPFDGFVSAEFTEVNPILDDQNQTAELIVELIGSLEGQRVVKPGT